jgi:hypothetical protein
VRGLSRRDGILADDDLVSLNAMFESSTDEILAKVRL